MNALRMMIASAAVLSLLGCGGGDNANMAPVSGTITYKGKPLKHAEVNFVNGDFSGFGRTDENGHYELVRGAPVGMNKVYITTVKSKDGGKIDTDIPGMDAEQGRALSQGANKALKKKNELPAEYSDPKQTKLEIDVPAGGKKDADFKLN